MQPTNLEETAASMEEISATVKNTADHTDEASKVASEVRTLAQRRTR